MDAAKYTVNEVEERTQVAAGTLRQWERRYGFPQPERSSSGYRLFSQNDIEHIEAMKDYIADGIPASRAAELVRNRQPAQSIRSPEEFKRMLAEALLDFDEARADRVLSEAHALHPVEVVLLDIIRSSMVDIGQKWHDGDITISTEHFASSYLLGRIRNLMTISGHNRSRNARKVVVACAPLDQHELGPMMLAVLLRRAGFRIFYIGANTPVADLHATVVDLDPDAVVVSATTTEAIGLLEAEREEFAAMAPLLVFGGPAFDGDPELAEELGGHLLSSDLSVAAERLESLFDQGVAA